MSYSRIICETDHSARSDISFSDPIIDYIIFCELDFYGIPEEYDDIDIADDDKRRKSLGKITGFLILSRVMDQRNEDAYITCDDHSADLETIMSILSNHDKEYVEDDIFYIHETDLQGEEFTEIMNRLPHIVLTHYHAFPNIICYYPSPLPYDEEKPKIYQAKEKMAEIIARDIITSNMQSVLGEKSETDKLDDEDIAENDKITVQLHLDEEQANYILGRHNDYNTYPESAKNKEEFAKFEQAGFNEFKGSRLLVRLF